MLDRASADVVTLGCRLNLAESETIRELIGRRAMVVVNTCGVTNDAVKQSRAAVRRAHRNRPDAEIVVTGCASEMDEPAFAALPGVTRVVRNAAKAHAATWGRFPNHPPPRRYTRAFVGVQNGCDHACTFCAIPLGRGKSRSDPASDVIRRIASLVDEGAREIVLSGVDLTSYEDHGTTLGALVARILDEVPALPRLRLSTLDTIEIDDQLFDLITGADRVMPHLHLSLQAGNDLILKRMRRRHSRQQAVQMVERIKARRDVTIGADLIAGFPTEDDTAFADTHALIADCDIVHAHVFPFSPRDGTPAARMPQVARAIVIDRAARLRAAGSIRKAAWLASLVGTTQEIVLEKSGNRGHTPGFAEARLMNEATIHPAEAGDVVLMHITASAGDHIIGTPA